MDEPNFGGSRPFSEWIHPQVGARYNWNMTESLQQAFDAASQLPVPDQDAFAKWILSELESESKWAELFGKSQDALAKLAGDALAEHSRGETKELD